MLVIAPVITVTAMLKTRTTVVVPMRMSSVLSIREPSGGSALGVLHGRAGFRCGNLEQAGDDRAQDRDRRLVLHRLRRAIRGAQRVERLIVQRAVDERLAERAFARPEAVGDLLGVARRDGEIVDRVLRLLVERV